MTMKMRTQKDDALNVATIHMLAMNIELIASTHYFRDRKNLKAILVILREATRQLNGFTTIAHEECDPVDCDPWVCCRGLCCIDCSQDAPPASKTKRARSR